MNRVIFFDTVRPMFGGSLSAKQVRGMEAILDEWRVREMTDLRRLAYCLGTTKHETANTMRPITEYGKRVYFKKYEPGTRIGKVLGNTLKGDGYRYRGRGYVQLTGRRNYHFASQKLGVGLVENPELALRPEISAKILLVGMAEGWFTGKKLSDYFNETKTDWRNARKIVNGLDKADTLAGYARKFHKALVLSKSVPVAPSPPPAPHPTSNKKKVAVGGVVAALTVVVVTFWNKISAFFEGVFN